MKCRHASMVRHGSILIVSALLSACGGHDKRDSANESAVVDNLEIPGLDDLPLAQRDAFTDGEITLAEYADAFESWLRCANDLNPGSIVLVKHDPVSGYIEYGITDSLGGSLDDPASDTGRCYEDYFRYVERVWQATDPVFLDQLRQDQQEQYENEQRPCLLKNGVDAPGAVVTGSPEQLALLDQWIALISAGKC